jgi:dihydroorotate dehydrogenase electron transfer subunit
LRLVLASVVRADASSLCVEAPGFPAHRPGQFAMLRLDPSGTRLDPLLPRPMAIYRREGQRLEFRFQVVGRGTRVLAELAPGASLSLVGPLGNGFELPRGRALLIGGGTGIASLYELARQLGPRARVALGARSRAALLGLADFEALGVELELATEDGSAGRRGLVTEGLQPRAGEELLACGPLPMLRAVRALGRAAGARSWVSLESPMACGFGICLGCVVPTRAGYRYVCTHGPVFDGAELDWEALA